MIDNFDALKEQLRQLSPIINGFKSEAVQLRIVELIFSKDAELPKSVATQETPLLETETSKRTRKPRNKPNLDSEGKKGQRKSTGKGLTAILNHQIEQGYFSQPRQAGDI